MFKLGSVKNLTYKYLFLGITIFGQLKNQYYIVDVNLILSIIYSRNEYLGLRLIWISVHEESEPIS